MDLQKGDEQYYKFHCRLPVSEVRYFKYVLWSRGGGDSHTKQTGMLVGNFEFNP